MDSHTLIQALIYLGAAALIVPIAVRLGLGSVLGYLIAGCIIGPWALRLVTDAEAILHFAEIGVNGWIVVLSFLCGGGRASGDAFGRAQSSKRRPTVSSMRFLLRPHFVRVSSPAL